MKSDRPPNSRRVTHVCRPLVTGGAEMECAAERAYNADTGRPTAAGGYYGWAYSTDADKDRYRAIARAVLSTPSVLTD